MHPISSSHSLSFQHKPGNLSSCVIHQMTKRQRINLNLLQWGWVVKECGSCRESLPKSLLVTVQLHPDALDLLRQGWVNTFLVKESSWDPETTSLQSLLGGKKRKKTPIHLLMHGKQAGSQCIYVTQARRNRHNWKWRARTKTLLSFGMISKSMLCRLVVYFKVNEVKCNNGLQWKSSEGVASLIQTQTISDWLYSLWECKTWSRNQTELIFGAFVIN